MFQKIMSDFEDNSVNSDSGQDTDEEVNGRHWNAYLNDFFCHGYAFPFLIFHLILFVKYEIELPITIFLATS